MLEGLTHGDEGRLLAETAMRVFALAGDPYARVAEAGLLALPFRESEGGFRPDAGHDLSSLAIAFAAKGAQFAVEDSLLRVTLAGTLLAAASPDVVEQLVSGTMRPAAALHEPGGRSGLVRCSTVGARTDDGWLVTGTKTLSLGAGDATHFLVLASTEDGRAIFLVDGSTPGIAVRQYGLRDGSTAADISLQACALPERARVLVGEAAEATLDEAIGAARVALTAEAAGMMRAAVERTVAYTSEREQFGKPIGTFQVLQHRMADMAIAADQAAAMAVMIAHDGSDREKVAQISKAVAELGISTFKSCIQLHGGYGMTEDLPFGLGLRRMLTIALLF